jgi:hypothetical protein
MLEALIKDVAPGVAALAFFVTLGVALGWGLEALGLARRLSRLAAPIMRTAQLPPVCATAFVAAFASSRAAGGMLSAARANGEISRRSLILGAVAVSFPSALLHLRLSAPVLIATLGAAGIAYVAFTVLNALIVLTFVLIAGRLKPEPARPVSAPGRTETAEPAAALPVPDWRTAWRRWRRLIPRVLLVAIPVYILVAYLEETGAFAALSKKMPPRLEASLPPASMAVIAMQMTSTTRAAPVARKFLDSGELSPAAVFFALVTGYVLSLPVRVLRRNLPGAVSLYPGRNGLWITLLSQGIRFAVASATVAVWLVVQIRNAP